jgi:hypothetical protein
MKRTYVFDWCEESQVTLGIFGEYCSGIYNPPLYSYPIDNGFIVIYPVLLNYNQLVAGPLGLPLIPLGDNEGSNKSGKKLFFKFRTYSKSNKFMVKPKKLTVLNDSNKNCTFSGGFKDDAGLVYSCKLYLEHLFVDSLKVKLTLSDNTYIDVSYNLSEYMSYRPIVAPNGPARDVEPFIIIEGEDD